MRPDCAVNIINCLHSSGKTFRTAWNCYGFVSLSLFGVMVIHLFFCLVLVPGWMASTSSSVRWSRASTSSRRWRARGAQVERPAPRSASPTVASFEWRLLRFNPPIALTALAFPSFPLHPDPCLLAFRFMYILFFLSVLFSKELPPTPL